LRSFVQISACGYHDEEGRHDQNEMRRGFGLDHYRYLQAFTDHLIAIEGSVFDLTVYAVLPGNGTPIHIKPRYGGPLFTRF
jgi:hypothetical protein